MTNHAPSAPPSAPRVGDRAAHQATNAPPRRVQPARMMRARLAKTAPDERRQQMMLAIASGTVTVLGVLIGLVFLLDLVVTGRAVHLDTQIVSLFAIVAAAMAAYAWLSQRRKIRELNSQAERLAEMTAELEASVEVLNDVNWELRESEERYRGLVDSQGDVIMRRDRNGRLIFVNDVFCTAFGITRAQAIGQTFSPTVVEGGGPRPLQREAGQRPSRFRYDQLLDTTVGQRWLAWEDFVIRDSAGKLKEVQSVGRDITERKRAEVAINEARDQAEQANRGKSMFLATMSHEIRTPMNGVLGMIGLLLDTKLTPEQRTYAKAVKVSGESLLTLIDEILDFSKIDAGKLRLEPAPLDLVDLVRGVAELLAPRAHQKHIQLAWHIDEKVPRHLIGDEKRLRQILFNLVGNAIKFTERGGVVIEAGIDEPATEAAADSHAPSNEAAATTIQFTVRDTGIGISPDVVGEIFEEFRQADDAPSRKYGGTGLGLAISKRLVNQMGGNIGVTSTPGAGSVFFFEVPLPVHGSERVGEAVDLAGSATLIVSRYTIEAELMERTLRAVGGECSYCDDPRLAVEMLTAAQAAGRPFATVIFDLELVGGTDRFLFAIADSHPESQRPHLIVLIAPDQRAHLDRAVELGADAYLLRPVRQASLVARVARDMTDSDQAGEEDGDEPKRAGATSRRILLAEDNEINAMLAIALLERAGHDVVRVEDGRKAVDALLSAARDKPFDLVLMDVHMPELDGLEATRQIRAMALGRDGTGPASTPIIALTANAMAEDKEHCLEAGMDDYVSKPLDIKNIERVVEEWGGQRSRAAGAGRLVA